MHPGSIDQYKTINVQRHGKHVLVSLARPHKSNALDDDMWLELPKVRPVSAYAGSFAGELTSRYLQVFDALDPMDDIFSVGTRF